MDGYDELVSLARRRHDLVAAGRYDEVAAVDAEAERLASTLPPLPPPDAAPALDALSALIESTRAALTDRLDATASELAGVRRGRWIARGYGSGQRSTLDAQA
jgi:hypothetical protein